MLQHKNIEALEDDCMWLCEDKRRSISKQLSLDCSYVLLYYIGLVWASHSSSLKEYPSMLSPQTL